MLSVLSLIQLVFLFLQLSIITLIDDALSVEGFAVFILIFFVIVLQVFTFNRVEKINNYCKLDTAYSLRILIAVFFLLVSVSIVILSQFDHIGVRHTHIDYSNVGLITKLAVVILPAMSFTIFLSVKSRVFGSAILIISIIISIYLAIVTLSKMAIIPYVIFMFFLFRIGAFSKRFFMISIIASFLTIYSIYAIRGQGDFIQVVEMIVFRIPMLNEASYVLSLLGESILLDVQDLFAGKNNSQYITEEIFDKDSRNVGIAPSFIGFNVIFFGYFFIFSIFLFIFVVYLLLGMLNTKQTLGRLLYFLWSLEFLQFFIDGNPTFYSSTTDSKMFYALVFLTFFSVYYDRIIKAKFKSFNKEYYEMG
jgi:hypothetical protein